MHASPAVLRSNRGQSSLATHNTAALLFVEATHTDSRHYDSVQEEQMLMSVYGSTSLQSSLDILSPHAHMHAPLCVFTVIKVSKYYNSFT